MPLREPREGVLGAHVTVRKNTDNLRLILL
jgi:hypothetical protein